MQRKETAGVTELQVLKQVWSEASVIPDHARWTLMTGGRSNPIWRVQIKGQPSLVCKLYKPASATPLFANDGTRESMALRALSGTGIAPEFVAFQDTVLGESLVYRHIDGQCWREEIDAFADLLARLHAQPIPDGLPGLSISPATLRAEGQRLSQEAGASMPDAPYIGDVPEGRQVFLHGDVVPGNIIVSPKGLRLIDWQCPAMGDPCADIAVFLSPAMQVIYGGVPLSRARVDQFLEAYAKACRSDASTQRYRALAPLFHWRMAAYCLWKGARGDQDYADAVALELEALQQG